MSTVPPNPANGQGLYEGTKDFRAHDDLCDNKIAGVYTHNSTRFSATECEELCDLQRWHNSILQSGTAPLVYNPTGGSLNAGTLVYISGWASDLPAVGLADADVPGMAAQYVLLDTIATGETGAAYPGGLVSNIDTSLGAIGDEVYAGTGGAWTLTAPSNPQVVGYVSVADGTVGAIQFVIKAPKAGTATVTDHVLPTITLTESMSGGVFTNAGATGTVTFDLPSAKAGLRYRFFNMLATQTLVVQLATGDVAQIQIDTTYTTAGGTASLQLPATQYQGGEFLALDDTTWIVTDATGATWSVS